MVTQGVREEAIWDALRRVPDPEIPHINLVDLGVIHKVTLGERINIEMLPTFIGCPALDIMKSEIRAALEPFGAVDVKVNYVETWTTENISEAGRDMLKAAGFAPPPRGDFLAATPDAILAGLGLELPMLGDTLEGSVHCPRCDSPQTRMDSPFGPTPCRQLYYCEACREPFERFKAV